MAEYATKDPWVTAVKGDRFGTDDTYKLAAEWLKPCRTVADWGGAKGYFRQFLPPDTAYMLVDGTKQVDGFVRVVDLAKYRGRSEGILLRHVLEMDANWKTILENALVAFHHRMAVVTFTPNVPKTRRAQWHLTWPCYFFNHDTDLIPLMQPYLVSYDEVSVAPKHLPERVYYLEKKELT